MMAGKGMGMHMYAKNAYRKLTAFSFLFLLLCASVHVSVHILGFFLCFCMGFFALIRIFASLHILGVLFCWLLVDLHELLRGGKERRGLKD